MKFRIMKHGPDGFVPTGDVFETDETDRDAANAAAITAAKKARITAMMASENFDEPEYAVDFVTS